MPTEELGRRLFWSETEAEAEAKAGRALLVWRGLCRKVVCVRSGSP